MQDELTHAPELHAKRVVGSRARVGPRDATCEEPEIQVQRKDGRIDSILIRCSCGEQITVHCQYAQ